MGPSMLKVLSMCLWSCWKRFSLQNFNRLSHPFFPVWGISSKLRIPFTTLFPPSNFPCTTVPAAVTQRPFCDATPKNTFLDPQEPFALIPVVTRVDMLAQVWVSCARRSHPELWHFLFVVVSAGLMLSLPQHQTSPLNEIYCWQEFDDL